MFKTEYAEGIVIFKLKKSKRIFASLRNFDFVFSVRDDCNNLFSPLFIDLVKKISSAVEKLEKIEIDIKVIKKNVSDVKMNSLETIENKLAYVENNTSTFEPK